MSSSNRGDATTIVDLSANVAALVLDLANTDANVANCIVDPGASANGEVLTIVNDVPSWEPASAAGAFTDLSDAPASYAGANSKIVAVKSDASGLEFIDRTDWTAFTPTGSWTDNVTYTGFYRKIGDNLEVRFKLAFTGASTAGALAINIPSPWKIDADKCMLSINQPCGECVVADVDTNWYPGTVNFSSVDTNVSLNLSYATGTYTAIAGVTNTVPAATANGDLISGYFSVPVIAA